MVTMSNERFVFAKNKFDGLNYIGTFRYVQKSMHVPKLNFPIKTKLEVAVFYTNSNKPTFMQAIGGPKLFMEFTDFGNMTSEEIDAFITDLIANENLTNLESGGNFARANKDNHFTRDITKVLNLPFFTKVNTIVYIRLSDDYIESRREHFN
jgi:hypothetical protein